MEKCRAKVKTSLYSAALGAFDGIHIAHAEILKNALSGGKGICITFRTPPTTKGGGMLMQPELKEQKLYEMGFDKVVMLDFEDVKNMPPLEFLKVITDKYNINRFCCGYDYRFGIGAAGDIAFLSRFCEERGLELSVHEPISAEGELVSSSAVRGYLKEGRLNRANKLLGHYTEIKVPVSHGDARGRTIGFPTVNQPMPEGFAELKFGVYETEIEIDGKVYSALTNFGIRPTFRLERPMCETYVIDFSGDVYGQRLTLKFKRFIRPEHKFDSLADLKLALLKDLESIRG